MKSSSLPWIESPTVALDLARPPRERWKALTDTHIRHGRALLKSVADQVPPGIERMADKIDERTGGVFRHEAEAIAARHGCHWRDIILANITYDLLIMQMGCSTVMLPTPDGPIAARNMDWAPEALLAKASLRI